CGASHLMFPVRLAPAAPAAPRPAKRPASIVPPLYSNEVSSLPPWDAPNSNGRPPAVGGTRTFNAPVPVIVKSQSDLTAIFRRRSSGRPHHGICEQPRKQQQPGVAVGFEDAQAQSGIADLQTPDLPDQIDRKSTRLNS